MPSVRTVVRTLIVGAFAIIGTGAAGVVLAGPAFAVQPAQAAGSAMPAQGDGQGQVSPATVKTTAADSSSPALVVSIDSVGPNRYATPGSTIVVNGTVTNDTGVPADDVQVQLSTNAAFLSRSVMEDYYTGQSQFFPNEIFGATWQSSIVHSHTTVSWSISFAASNGGFGGFNVYPLVAAVSSASSGGSTISSARTLLPYYPGPGIANDAPQKLDVAWIWPLEDQPQQNACPQDLSTNDLAASFQSGGRLNGLLTAGLRYAATTKLTWAVDPALLSDATVMSQQYKVGGDVLCTGTTVMPASQPASTWLSDLRTGTSSQPMFVTGYADPDVSALTHAGLGSQVAEAYSLGDTAAGSASALGKSFGTGAKIAWPDGGYADTSTLTTLAREAGVSTTVLSSSEMPVSPLASSFVADDAVAPKVTTGSSTSMNVLLADSSISSLLGSATASPSASTQFTLTQDFLAETAMIVAEAPSTQRSLVVAPPSRWDPSPNEASTLLSLTRSPWLTPVTLSSLTSRKPTSVERESLATSQAAPLELGKEYLASVQSDQQKAGMYKDLLAPSSETAQTTSQLSVAIAVTESAAWRGGSIGEGRLAVQRLKDYVTENDNAVRIISSNKVLLAGTSGETPVSVFNGLPSPVEVQVRVSVPPGSQISVSNLTPIIVPAKSIKTIGMKVHSPALGSTLVQLQLLTKDGTPVPGATQSLNVETTRFGRTLLILIAAALGVLVLASLARWTRRKVARLRNGGGGHHVRGKNVKSGSAGDHGAALSSARTSSGRTSSASVAGSGSGGTG